MRERYDVAIVGYGPVGQALAIALGARGWRVGVFEKQPAAYPLPRAVHFDHEVGRILQSLDVVDDDLLALTEAGDSYEWRNAAGDVLLCIRSRASSVSGWPEANMLAQPDLERCLDARARSLPSVDVWRGQEVIAITTAPGGVTLAVLADDGSRTAVHARYVIGCDGANSFVRSHLGATVTDLGFFFDWLIVDVIPNVPRRWSPLNIQICDPARPTTLVSGGRGRRRWEFMRLPGESLDDLNNEATAWRLLAPWDVTPENATLERHTVYRFQARWVDTWRRGPLLLAGDAAHQMPPFAGQGMCSGFRDAVNLAWKLDLVLRGAAPETLLDTYASERVPHVRATIDFSMELGKIICVADPAEAAARDAMMTSMTASGAETPPPTRPPLGPGVVRAGDPRAGELFVQGMVEHAGTTGLFDDVVGRGWVLLGIDGDPAAQLDDDTAAFFRSLGGITADVGPHGRVRDRDGLYARWFADGGVRVVMQRPDFQVFGTAARADGARALVADLRALLAAPPVTPARV